MRACVRVLFGALAGPCCQYHFMSISFHAHRCSFFPPFFAFVVDVLALWHAMLCAHASFSCNVSVDADVYASDLSHWRCELRGSHEPFLGSTSKGDVNPAMQRWVDEHVATVRSSYAEWDLPMLREMFDADFLRARCQIPRRLIMPYTPIPGRTDFFGPHDAADRASMVTKQILASIREPTATLRAFLASCRNMAESEFLTFANLCQRVCDLGDQLILTDNPSCACLLLAFCTFMLRVHAALRCHSALNLHVCA